MFNRFTRFLVVAAFVMAASAVGAGAAATRGFMFSIGGGATTINYGAVAESIFASAEALGLDRLELELDMAAGGAVTQDLYLVGCIDAFATRFSDVYGNWIQLNSYLYGGGVRLYPFHTGLVLGAEGGLARVVAMSSAGGLESSPMGWGAAALIAYDFNGAPTGFALEAGLRANYNVITDWSASAVSLFVDLAWK